MSLKNHLYPTGIRAIEERTLVTFAQEGVEEKETKESFTQVPELFVENIYPPFGLRA